ncbi:MAG: Rossmann-like and DUF2520 domain-containing protein [Flavobacteriaceae bacterium]
MAKVTIIGSGNVAHHLIRVFSESPDVKLVQVFARNKKSLSGVVADELVTDSFSELKPADVYLISVTDDAIAEVSEKLPFSGKLVAHTSGTQPLDILSDKNRRAVFYPLQTFSKGKKVNFKEIPICLESENPQDFDLLKNLAKNISDKVYDINSEKRKALHVAAVFVSNFVNHLYKIGSDICEQNQIPFEILKPLIVEVADKIKYLDPNEAQTGPAKRGDLQIINAHLEFLKNDTEKQEIYNLLTKAIMKDK